MGIRDKFAPRVEYKVVQPTAREVAEAMYSPQPNEKVFLEQLSDFANTVVEAEAADVPLNGFFDSMYSVLNERLLSGNFIPLTPYQVRAAQYQQSCIKNKTEKEKESFERERWEARKEMQRTLDNMRQTLEALAEEVTSLQQRIDERAKELACLNTQVESGQKSVSQNQ
jgi:septal ring factor EnvC (AmiA/AmiB activator)